MAAPNIEPPQPTQPAARFEWVAPTFRLHVWTFVALNASLHAANIAMGRPWWAFWPLLVTGLVLSVHYLLYKALAVDQRWVDERVEELNLKSYDRSHIEELKARYDPKNPAGDRTGR